MIVEGVKKRSEELPEYFPYMGDSGGRSQNAQVDKLQKRHIFNVNKKVERVTNCIQSQVCTYIVLCSAPRAIGRRCGSCVTFERRL